MPRDTYIDKLVERFLPGGVPPSLQGNSLPYSRNLDKHVSDAASRFTLYTHTSL